jgi:GNAT superfamily N-acetyltransferase
LRIYASTRELELSRVPWSDAEKHAFVRFQFEAQRKHYYAYYGGAEYSVIEADGQPAGRLYVHRRSDETRIVDITVLPAFRNAGIGTTLLERLMAEARAGDKPLRIHVEQDNPARRLYERLGFRQLDHAGLYILMEWRPSTVS